MAIESKQYLIQNIEDMAFFVADGSCKFLASDLQEATWSNEQEDVYATGKNGVRIGSSSRNKASRMSATNGVILEGALAAQAGSDVVTESAAVPYMEILTVASGKATLTYKPNADIPYIYGRTTDGGLGTTYSMNTAASATEFALDTATGVITVPTDVADGEQIVVFYEVMATGAKRVSNYANQFSEEGKLIATVLAKNTCDGKSYVGKVIFPHCKAAGNFEMSFGDEFSVQNLEFEALSSSCSGAVNLLWDFVIFDEADLTKVS